MIDMILLMAACFYGLLVSPAFCWLAVPAIIHGFYLMGKEEKTRKRK